MARPLPTIARPLPTIAEQRPPNHWEKIIKQHAANLDHLPVPPKNFFQREEQASKLPKASKRRGKRRGVARSKTSLQDLLRANEQRTSRLTMPRNTCHNWVLRPISEKAPEPSPGVPRITVTTPEGETCWPKDMNPYISREKVAFLTERVTKDHDGPTSDTHCQVFQQLYQKGLYQLPYGHRPEILFCTKCLDRQMEIEDNEAGLAPMGSLRIASQELQAITFK